MAYLFATMSAMLFIASGNLALLGFNWMDSGTGINAWIALPSAAVALWLAYSSSLSALERAR